MVGWSISMSLANWETINDPYRDQRKVVTNIDPINDSRHFFSTHTHFFSVQSLNSEVLCSM